MDNIGEYVSDDELAIGPLSSLGWMVETRSWRDMETDWSGFEAAVIRTTWDYHNHPDSFLESIRSIDAQTHLENPLELVEWNLRKNYLLDLKAMGVRIVPSVFEQGPVEESNFKAWQDQLDASELIIKPLVSATAGNTFRFSELTGDISDVFKNLDYIVQPLMKNILCEGEYSLFFFDGKFSHVILKKPAEGDFRVQEDFGGSNRPVSAPPRLIDSAKNVVNLIDPVPLYARVDFVREGGDEFALMELELIEPSLYFRMDKESPRRFAEAFDTRMNEL